MATITPTASRTARPLTVSVRQARSMLGFGEATMYRAIRSGEIPSVRVGRAVRVRADWLEEQLGQPVEEPLARLDGEEGEHDG